MPNGISPTSPLAFGQQYQPMQLLAARVKSGSSWFLWIAILSVLNAIIVRIEGGISFIVGLGLTQLVDAVAHGMAAQSDAGLTSGAMIAAFVFDLLVVGLFLLFWRLSLRGLLSAYMAGMVIYAIDGLLFVMLKQFLSVAFHVFALYRLYGGYVAARQLQRLSAQEAQATATVTGAA